MAEAISFDQIDTFRKNLATTPGSAALSKAVQNVGPIAASHAAYEQPGVKPTFSIEIDTGTVTNQKQSGRCWMFAELNTMRHFTNAKFGIKDLEFSQAYLAFYDRLEKANLFLEEIIASADQPTSDRLVAAYLAGPNGDGGYFDNAAALIEKYGIVPKSVMPETYNSSKTAELNSVLHLKLRKDAVELRTAAANGAGAAALQTAKTAQLSDIYRILAYAYGNPTESFDFEYRDTDKNYHIDRDLTPRTFYEKYVNWDLDDFVTITSTPAADKAYYQAYTLPTSDTVVGGRPVVFINVPRDVMQELAIASLKANETVWFGNDVLEDMDRDTGTLKGGLFDYSTLFDTDLEMTKADRFATRQAHVSHAMTLTGVDLVDGQPTKWKVENSWGDDRGHDGYFTADQQWFTDYVYECGIKKDLLPEQVKQALTKEPIVLPIWDPLA